MNTTRQITVIEPYVKRSAYRNIQHIALKSNGCIFGGYVRDHIIAEHYTTLYKQELNEKKERFNMKKFWNPKKSEETAHRMLVPTDMDVFFDNSTDMQNFVDNLMVMCKAEHIDVVAQPPDASKTRYSLAVEVQRFILTIEAGKIPFITNGHSIEVSIDIVSLQMQNITVSPPFYNLDFLCNGFVMNKNGIVFSNNTGTYIDKMSCVERTAEVHNIMQDMLQYKTKFCMVETSQYIARTPYDINDSLLFHSYALTRVKKMLAKAEKWAITNLPFEVAPAHKEHLETDCCICQCSFKEAESVAIVSSAGEDKVFTRSITHTHCIIDYMSHQLSIAHNSDDYVSETFCFQCPVRTPIDFMSCSL